MKNKLLPLFPYIFAVLLCSCHIVGEGADDSYLYDESYGNFWAQDFITNRYDKKYYRVDAELLAEGEHCVIWAEKVPGIGKSEAKRIAEEYDSKIYPGMMNVFCENFSLNDDEEEFLNLNTMELADWLGDRDGRLCILLLNIKDGYQDGVNYSYVAGYFWSGDLLNRDHSNKRDMIYIDAYPGIPGEPESYRTIAHELQHLMNFVTSYAARWNEDAVYLYPMDTWIDEGLSAAAEWIYSRAHTDEDIAWFNKDPTGLICKGNNFFVWDNHNRDNENPYAVLDDYATVYLFFQWLRLQTQQVYGGDGSDIYKDIITSPFPDYRAVTQAANSYMSGNGYSEWGTLLKTWLAANYINESSGRYGYGNDEMLRKIKAKTVPDKTLKVPLAPGEGVYSITTNNFAKPNNTGNIRYAGLNDHELNDTRTFNGGALLTYNVNTNKNDIIPDDSYKEEGETTGVGADIGIIANSPSRQAFSPGRPFVISAADMLRRNGHEESFKSFDLPKLLKRIGLNE